MFGKYLKLLTPTSKPRDLSQRSSTHLKPTQHVRTQPIASVERSSMPQPTRTTPITCTSTTRDGDGQRRSTSTTTIKSLRRRFHDGIRRSKHKKRRAFSCGADGEAIKPEDTLDTMSESARIAYYYRCSEVVRRDDSDCHPVLMHSDQALPTDIDNGSCAPRCTQDMCPTTQRDDMREAGQGTRRLHDMLDSLNPIIIDLQKIEFDDRAALKAHRAVPNSIVLPSHSPDGVPHIVITPPPEDESLQAPYVAQNNRLPMQSQSSLLVPPFFMMTCRMPTYEEWCAIVCPPPPVMQEEEGQSRTPGARLVFRHSAFQKWIQVSESERTCHFMRLIVPAVARHLYKATALTASLAASDFRARYDVPGFVESLELPFRWTDPAEALLALYRTHPVGVHYLPSSEPFSVPHILIEQARGNDPQVVDANMTPIQDWRGNNSLVVFSTRQTFTPSFDNSQLDEIDSQFEADSDSSCSDSSGPPTPTDLRRVQSGFFSDEADYPSIYSGPYSKELLPDSETDSHSPEVYLRNDVKARFFIDEDEDDGPPEYDEWFQTIADRTRQAEDAENAAL